MLEISLKSQIEASRFQLCLTFANKQLGGRLRFHLVNGIISEIPRLATNLKLTLEF